MKIKRNNIIIGINWIVSMNMNVDLKCLKLIYCGKFQLFYQILKFYFIYSLLFLKIS
jgi:hypothetical protein